MLLKTWKKEEPILEGWRKRFDAVIVVEEDNILEARPISYSLRNTYEIDLPTIISIYAVDSYREASKISKLYNQMISRKIKPSSLLSIVEAVNILGEN